jgi:single-strand DNA-binding protein
MLAAHNVPTQEDTLFDTNLVIVGNVLNAPEWRRIQNSGSLVANFRIASTARRFDRANNCWVDGNHLRVRVVAWRRLAEGVASSITVGDPVIVYGRVYTREWKDDNGNNRTSYEMEAFSIGHDLARGRSRFFRTKAGQGTAMVADAEAEALVGGELTDPVAPDEVPVGYGDGMPDRFAEEPEPTFAEEAEEPVTAASPESESPESESPESESPASGSPTEDELTLEVERLVAENPPGTTRRTRRTRKEPVAA